MLEQLTRDQFVECLDDTFQIALESSRLDLTLVRADKLGGDAPSRQRQPFSLIFAGPREPVLPQRTYRFEHARLGVLDIFIVPVGPDERGMRYEAIFT